MCDKNKEGIIMNKLTNYLFLFIILIFLTSCKNKSTITEPETPQIELDESEKEIVNELDNYITPLNGTSPSLDNSDLSVFDKFSDAKIIGLGEATHGTKEFFEMKHRIFKYFAENYGFKIFGFEADMGECIYIDRFITKGIGTIDEAMNKMHFWTWKTMEVKDLILWMKNYNVGKSPQNQIHLLGIDCQYTNYNKGLIEDYLKNYENSYPNYIDSILEKISSLTYQDGEAINTTEKLKLKNNCDSVYTYFENNKNSLISKSGEFEYDIIVRLLEESKQFLDVITETLYNYRDYYMAKNAIRLTNLLGGETKVILWAHNLHVARDLNFSTGSLGYVISLILGINYKVIGFSFDQGEFQAINYDQKTNQYTGLIIHDIERLPLRESTNYIFQAANPKDFILLFSNVPNTTPLYNWLNSYRLFMSIGSVYSIDFYNSYYYNANLLLFFDAIIHIQKTNSAIAYQ